PVPPIGVPAVMSLAFWGGVWGIAIWPLLRHAAGAAYWLRALLIGAVGPSASWPPSAAMLVAYGLVVNANRLIHFGRLMGLYIAVFLVVSQVLSLVLFGERPSPSLVLGGALVVAGGL